MRLLNCCTRERERLVESSKRKGNGYIRKKESLRKPPKRITLVEMLFVYRFKSLTRWVENRVKSFTLWNSNAED